MGEKIEENLTDLGLSGKVVILTKDLIKDGKTSTIKPGKARTMVLHKPLAVGHPVVERKLSTRSRTEGIPMGYRKTSNIQKITKSTDKMFTIETVTSFYSVIFI